MSRYSVLQSRNICDCRSKGWTMNRICKYLTGIFKKMKHWSIHAWGPSYCSSVALDWHPALMKETKQCIAIRHPTPKSPRLPSLCLKRKRTEAGGGRGGGLKKGRKKYFLSLSLEENFCYYVSLWEGVSRGRKTHSSCQRWRISSLTLSTRRLSSYRSRLLNNAQRHPLPRK